MKKKNYNAFTLAEVLITLTIIGVIAALTIPNLMQSWKKHARLNEIKAAYSILNNMVRLSVAENGDTYAWDNCNDNTQINFVEKYYIPYLKIQYKCGKGSASKTIYHKNGCFVPDGGAGTMYLLNGEKFSSGGYDLWWHYTMKLQNGMSLGVFKTGDEFIIDVNGNSGPNRAGVDIFSFSLDKETGRINGTKAWSTSDSISAILTSTYNKGCNTEAGMSGLACARVIELNGWLFPDDYPVKKW